ncbi:MAG: hypothetical protein A2X17_02675 [Bacteroidetes bacterium GWF2_41_61]|jgi:hypothetical protein|nr:MAG: hypothetical protein A2X20_09310 [Bacteroidetes bacterium GWE2_40_15]OFY27628.1 MAG: hypothetical protein A2X17_02675 [Bacteroidetes bacterium GWF2_41_61]OFY90244.1 MAG: hypothetical protein A2266_06410 [Bacteroidetes bacterium RIFOXYA12_FULL_40_10]PKP05940.1 MAG: hypothetical protein CVU10_11445 [Bacteroidetes bacterium HGW-Bacteroidetes-5]HBG25120.1 hypothetical protein [Rikenellaceae bacterium]
MVYRYKASIPGNKIFMREYEVKGSSSLYSYHLYLQNDLGFAPDQIVLFRALDSKGKVKREYGLFNLGDGSMDSVTLDKVCKDGFPVLEYVYDMFKERSLYLELLSTEEELARRAYPRLVAERGKNPDQFSDNYDDFEHLIEAPETDLIIGDDEIITEGEQI